MTTEIYGNRIVAQRVDEFVCVEVFGCVRLCVVERWSSDYSKARLGAVDVRASVLGLSTVTTSVHSGIGPILMARVVFNQ